jgi:hypothetical protein
MTKIIVLTQNIIQGDVRFILEIVDRLNARNVEEENDKCSPNVGDEVSPTPLRSSSGTGGRGGYVYDCLFVEGSRTFCQVDCPLGRSCERSFSSDAKSSREPEDSFSSSKGSNVNEKALCSVKRLLHHLGQSKRRAFRKNVKYNNVKRTLPL